MQLSASSIIGDRITNHKNEDLGEIEDLMIDTENGIVDYAVLSYGGILGMGNKLFAVPLEALSLNSEDKCFILDADKSYLENAPGFDKDNWPNTSDSEWRLTIRRFYHLP